MIAFQAMFPVMVVDDLAQLKAYYEAHFGFNAVFYDPEFYLHLVAPDNGVQLGFLLPNHPSQPPILHAKMVNEGYVMSFEVADAHQAHQQAKQMQLQIVLPLTDEAWGQRHFILQDPAGLYIDMVEQLEGGS